MTCTPSTSRLGAVARLEAALALLEGPERDVRAWVVYDAASARQSAARIDAQRCAPPLGGMVVGVKDTINVAGFATGCGAEPVGALADRDAHGIARLRAAGAVMLGKTVTAEHAYLDPGPTRNPRDPSRTPGGSSSGSAAAVAAGMADLCLGTQTGGSIIRPASYCGVIGFKPSLGRYPMSGVRALAPSFDTLGMLARDMAAIIAADRVLAGEPPLPLGAAPASPRIAVCLTPLGRDSDAGAAVALEPIMPRIAAAGFSTIDVQAPESLNRASDASSIIVAKEAAGIFPKEGSSAWRTLGPQLRDLLRRGARVDADEETTARLAIGSTRVELAEWLDAFDALVIPSAPSEAPSFEEGTGDSRYNRGLTALGLPCLSLPLCFGERGLPIGIQLVTGFGQDDALLAIGRRMEVLFAGEHPKRAGE